MPCFEVSNKYHDPVYGKMQMYVLYKHRILAQYNHELRGKLMNKSTA